MTIVDILYSANRIKRDFHLSAILESRSIKRTSEEHSIKIVMTLKLDLLNIYNFDL